jgi:transposase
MAKACSVDLRERVIESVEEGSRHEAAERFAISVSSAVKWLQAWQREGRRTARPRGGSRSLLEDHAEETLALLAEWPEWTREEFVVAMHKTENAG